MAWHCWGALAYRGRDRMPVAGQLGRYRRLPGVIGDVSKAGNFVSVLNRPI